MVIKPVGFLIENLASSQTALSMISSINKYVEKNIDVSFNVFVEEQFVPCLHPKVPKLGIRDAFLFYGPLIATSLKTATYLKDFPRSKHFFYIQDLEWLRKGVDVDSWKIIMEDPSIVKFCRAKDHFDAITNCGHQICPKIVDDFDVAQTMEIINADTK